MPPPGPGTPPPPPPAWRPQTWGEKIREKFSGWGSKAREAIAQEVRESQLATLGEVFERSNLRHKQGKLLEQNEKQYQKFNEQSIEAELTFKSHGQMADHLKGELQRLTQSIEQVRNMISPKELINYEREKTALADRIGKAEAQRDQAQTKLEQLNAQKSTWEERGKDIARQANERIEQSAKPFKEQLQKAETGIQDFKNEIQSFQETKVRLAARRTEIATQIKDPMLNRVAGATFKRQLAEVDAQLKQADRHIEERKKEQLALEERASKLKARVNGWTDVSNELARLANRPRTYAASGTKENIRVEDRTAVPQNNPNPNPPPPPPPGPGGAPNPLEKSFVRMTLTPQEYADMWNKHFKTRFEMRPQEIEQLFAQPADAQAPAPDLESRFRFNLRSLIRRKDPRVKMSEGELERNVESMRIYFEAR